MYELEDSIPLFLKFTTDEVADILLKGNFRLRNLKYYREYEDKEGKGIGDRYDGSVVLHNVTITLTNPLNGETIQDKIEKVSVHDENLIRLPVFCLFRVDNRMLKYSKVIDNDVSFKPYLEKEEIDKIKEEFGDTVVMLSAGTFVDVFKKYCSENGIGMVSGNVEYVDFKNNTKQFAEMFKDPSDPQVCFKKDICFSHQKEYRFLLDKPLIEDYLDVHLEGLVGKVHKLSVDEFFSGKLELRYPLIEKSELR